MDRLIASNTVAVGSGDTAPATGTPGQATSGNPATNTPATVFPAYAFNALQEELMAVIVGAGLTPARNTWNQLLTAIQTIIQSGVSNVCIDTGTVNAYVTTLTPALSAPVAGSPFWMKVKTTNNGASTLNATGTAYPLVGGAHAALQGNELVANGWALIDWNATLNSYVLFECAGASVQIAPATASAHALPLGQANTAYLGKQALITSSGMFTCPNVPGVSTYTMYATVIPGGGGGAGGGSALGSASTSGAAGGGGGGGAGAPIYKQAITVAPGQVLTATIGAGGIGGAGSQAIGTAASAGNAGGSTTLTGSSPTVNLSATGGPGGGPPNNANATSSSAVATGGAGGSNGASAGSFGVLGTGSAYGGVGGAGASSNIGQGGGAPTPNGGATPGTAGKAASGYGAGGSGGNGGAALTTTNVEGGGVGGNGTAGAILLEW